MSCQQIQNINRMFGNELTIDASYDVNQLLKFQSEQPPQISI